MTTELKSILILGISVAGLVWTLLKLRKLPPGREGGVWMALLLLFLPIVVLSAAALKGERDYARVREIRQQYGYFVVDDHLWEQAFRICQEVVTRETSDLHPREVRWHKSRCWDTADRIAGPKALLKSLKPPRGSVR